jgi:hypothetical protein
VSSLTCRAILIIYSSAVLPSAASTIFPVFLERDERIGDALEGLFDRPLVCEDLLLLLRLGKPQIVAKSPDIKNRLRKVSDSIPVQVFTANQSLELATGCSTGCRDRELRKQLGFGCAHVWVRCNKLGLRMLDIGTSFEELRGDPCRDFLWLRPSHM